MSQREDREGAAEPYHEGLEYPSAPVPMDQREDPLSPYDALASEAKGTRVSAARWFGSRTAQRKGDLRRPPTKVALGSVHSHTFHFPPGFGYAVFGTMWPTTFLLATIRKPEVAQALLPYVLVGVLILALAIRYRVAAGEDTIEVRRLSGTFLYVREDVRRVFLSEHNHLRRLSFVTVGGGGFAISSSQKDRLKQLADQWNAENLGPIGLKQLAARAPGTLDWVMRHPRLTDGAFWLWVVAVPAQMFFAQ